MRTLLLIATLILSFSTESETNVAWHTNYDEALDVANDKDKNILMYFTGSDWCAPCIQLKKDLFETKEFEDLSKQYVLLYIDIPRRNDIVSAEQKEHNKEVFKKFNKTGVFPLFLAVSPKGKVLDEYSGYSMNGEISYHLDFLERNQ